MDSSRIILARACARYARSGEGGNPLPANPGRSGHGSLAGQPVAGKRGQGDHGNGRPHLLQNVVDGGASKRWLRGSPVLNDFEGPDAGALYARPGQVETTVPARPQQDRAGRRQVGIGIEVAANADGMGEDRPLCSSLFPRCAKTCWRASGQRLIEFAAPRPIPAAARADCGSPAVRAGSAARRAPRIPPGRRRTGSGR